MVILPGVTVYSGTYPNVSLCPPDIGRGIPDISGSRGFIYQRYGDAGDFPD
jgi:hypothetical protein